MEKLFTEFLSMPFITGLLSEMGTSGVAAVQEVASVSHDEAVASINALFTANNIWMMLATALVFIMHLGFASVEAGFTQAKNTVNILYKNTLTLAIGLLSYTLIGFSLMYPGEFSLGSWLGWSGLGLSLP